MFVLAIPLIAAALANAYDHRVVVGGPGLLVYNPSQVSANVGDTVTFEFHQKNHTATQAAFESPCSPLNGGFDSGFNPVPENTTFGFPTYTIHVNDNKPIWAYCRQTGHCPQGMVFAVNAPPTGNTFDAFKAKALASSSTSSSSTTSTAPPSSSSTASSTDHRVIVGGPGLLIYNPSQVSANVGDTVTFEFHQKNHTATQAAFDSPCSPLNGGFNSGFNPVPDNTTFGFPTYTIKVNDTKPIWGYCQQKGHCPQGMVFSVNAPTTGNTFDAFKAKALALGTSSTSSASTTASATYSVVTKTVTDKLSTYTTTYTTLAASTVTDFVTVTKTVTDHERGSTYMTTYTTNAQATSTTTNEHDMKADQSSWANSPSASPVTHKIVVGGLMNNGTPLLAYTPPFVKANVGDFVEFEFHVKNHTVTQSSFSYPCTKLEKASYGSHIGFDSGFMPVAPDAVTFPTFKIRINDTKPVWGYCRQTGHCVQGMVFGINPQDTGPNTFYAFQQLAKHSNASSLTNSSSTGSAAGYAPTSSSSAKWYAS